MENEVKTNITFEEQREIIEDNFETMRTAYGSIRFGKGMYKVCGVVGAAATLVGGVGIIGLGFTTAPVIAVGAGITAIVASVAFHKQEETDEFKLYEEWEKNRVALEKVNQKINKTR